MSKFKGKNATKSAKNLFYRRLKFKNEMTDGVMDKALESIKDFHFADNVYYGKVNMKLEPIIPKFNLLKGFNFNNAQESGITLIEFVSDQLNDLLNNLNTRVLIGDVSKNCFINNLSVAQGFSNPID